MAYVIAATFVILVLFGTTMQLTTRIALAAMVSWLGGCASYRSPTDPALVLCQAEHDIALAQKASLRSAQLAGAAEILGMRRPKGDGDMPRPQMHLVSSQREAAGPLAVPGRDDGALPTPQPIESSAGERGEPLSLRAAQCTAVRHSPLANALDRHARQVRQQGERRQHLEDAARLVASLVYCQAVTERNKAAKNSYDAFYRLGELQQQRLVLSEMRSLIADNEVALQRIRDAGLTVDVDPSETQRQQLDLRQQDIDLEHGVERLAQSLNVLMGKPRLSAIPTIQADLGSERELVDVEQAVTDGIACRSDLNQLRMLMNCVDTGNVDTVKQLIALLQPVLGAVVKPKCESFSCLRCLIKCNDCCDVQQLKRQTQDVYNGVKEMAEVEISGNAIQVNQAIRSLYLAEESTKVWADRVRQLERIAEGDSNVYQSLAAARASRLKAISQAIRAATALELARGELLASQGYLARQCGSGDCCGARCSPPPIATTDGLQVGESSRDEAGTFAARLLHPLKVVPSIALPATLDREPAASDATAKQVAHENETADAPSITLKSFGTLRPMSVERDGGFDC